MMKTGVRAIGAVAVTLSLAGLVAPSASAAVGHGGLQVEIATVNGAGCPAGSAAVEALADGFSVRYRDYTAKIGGDARPTEARKNCQISLKVTPPEGLTYAVTRADHRGSDHLAAGATGLLRAQHYYAGQPSVRQFKSEVKGPLSDDWMSSDVVGDIELYWLPCGMKANLNLNTELRLSASDKSETSSMDMNSGLGSTYHFKWKSCG